MAFVGVAPAPLVGENAPMTADEFLRLKGAGAFGKGRTELRRGRVILKMPTSPLHAKALALVMRELNIFNSDEVWVGSQSTIRLSLYEAPEPDVFIVRGDVRDPDGDIEPHDILLAIEVSLTSLRDDRTEKAAVYAEAGIPEYWIVNPVGRQIEVRRFPSEGAYRESFVVPANGEVAPLFAPETRFAAASLMPRAAKTGDKR